MLLKEGKIKKENKASVTPVQGMSRPGFFFQPKLTVGPVDDAYEREADAVADKVMRQEKEGTVLSSSPIDVQRKCSDCEEEEKEQQVCRKESSNAGAGHEVPDTVHQALQSGGRPMDARARKEMEGHFGYDFSQVKIHTDTLATKSAQSINALAYTSGNNIVFNEAQYAPGTEHGKKLLAHELTHVVQQQGSSQTVRRKSWVDDEAGCTTTQKILIQLIFDDVGSDKWTTTRRTTFRNDMKSSIESTFNGNPFHIKPAVSSYAQSSWGCSAGTTSVPCPCHPNGFAPKVEVDFTPDGEWSTSEDWEVDVAANSAGTDKKSNSNTSYGDLDEADTKAVTKKSSGPGITQVPAVHEFGHFLGLHHPGKGLSEGVTIGGVTIIKRELSPGATEYGHVGTDKHGRTVDGTIDLMGGGMGLRPFYFDSWKDHLKSKYGSDCEWSIQ